MEATTQCSTAQDDRPRYGGRPIRNVLTGERRAAQIDILLGGIVRGLSVPQAAEAANLATTTAYEILAHPDIKARLADLRGQALKVAASSASALAEEAVQVLADLMRNSKSDPVRRLAADSILTHANAMAGDAELQERVNAMTAEIDALLR